MKKAFSTINLLIIICLIILSFIIWQKYFKTDHFKKIFKSQEQTEEKMDEEKEKKEEEVKETEEETKEEEEKEENKEEEEERTPKDPTIPPEEEEEKEKEEEEEKPSCLGGVYENKTYYYTISCPDGWPLRVRNEGNVSIGTVPPKNGQGAITIEVEIEGIEEEIEDMKAEAQKYAGMISITEEMIIVAGVQGEKITLENNMANSKDVYIVLKKNNFNYLLKYSHESPEFVSLVEDTLKTFEFTK